MAAVDKIYGIKAQYVELYKWLKKNKPGAIKYLYLNHENIDELEERPISNFPEKVDKWLLKNCPLTWVTDYIKYQYGLYPFEGGNDKSLTGENLIQEERQSSA